MGVRASVSPPPSSGQAGLSGVAGANLQAGTPVVISRQNGQLLAARADTYVLAFVAGFLKSDVGAGFVGGIAEQPLTLADWTAVTGAQSLVPGSPYYLGASGGLVTTPDLTTKTVVRLGTAASPTTLNFERSNPITL